MEKYVYFVSYSYSKGEGMIRISMNRPLDTYSIVLDVKKYIDEEINDDVIILNWKRLKD